MKVSPRARRSAVPAGRTTVSALCGKIEGMMSADRDFVERRQDSFYLSGCRVPLACVVREFQDGQSPEAIRSAFPTLTLEQVYGAITFYLGHRAEVDEDLAAREREENAFSETNPVPADVKAKLDRARDQLHSR
ncbi:MAG: DUF433 domain-containing protein [Luteitalea sp.]|nr:DUF433 domain-containing protein [Luteitalea sp.]